MLAGLAVQVPLYRTIMFFLLPLVPCLIETLFVGLDGEVSLEAGYRADVEEFHTVFVWQVARSSCIRLARRRWAKYLPAMISGYL